MIRKTLMSLMFGAAAVCSSTVTAGVIQFDTCFARCGELGVSSNDDVGVLASLQYSDNGEGGVLFELTHSFSNSYTPGEGTYLTKLLLNMTAEPTGISGLTNNIKSIDFDLGNLINAGLNFGSDVDLKDDSRRRLLNGQSASWTFLGISEADITGTALVHIRDLPALGGNTQGGGRVKIIGTASSVPEPAGILLLGAGLALFGRRMVLRTK